MSSQWIGVRISARLKRSYDIEYAIPRRDILPSMKLLSCIARAGAATGTDDADPASYPMRERLD
jgi:hypothetical protein